MDYLWKIFFIGWLICSVIVVLLMILGKSASSTTVDAFSKKIDTYSDLLYAALMVALGPAVLIIEYVGVIERSLRKPLPWKKRNVNF